MNFIHITDIHVARSATYRVDDIMDALCSKFKQLRAYIDQYKVTGVFISGDIFNSNQGTKIPYDVVNEFITMLQSLETPVYGIAGNHDMYLKEIDKHPLKTLFASGVIQQVGRDPVQVGEHVYLFGFEHNYEKDTSQFDTSHWTEAVPSFKIGLTHLVLGKEPGMYYAEPQYGIEEFTNSDVDLFLNGHIHTPLGPFTNSKGQIFCQPGAFRRTNTASEEMDRVPQVTLISIDSAFEKKVTVKYLPIEVRHDIFKNWKKEIKTERTKELEAFIERVANIKSSTKTDLAALIREANVEPEVREVLESYLSQGE